MISIFKSIPLVLLLSPLTILAAPINRRQLAGEGAACNSILSDTDNAVGYGVANAETNTAATVAGLKQPPALPAVPASPGQPGKRELPVRRQANKIFDGFVPLANVAGLGPEGAYLDTNGDYIDTISTDDAATAGDQIGTEEENSIEGAGALIPRE